jgi:hypothetical protein
MAGCSKVRYLVMVHDALYCHAYYGGLCCTDVPLFGYLMADNLHFQVS